MIDLTEIIAAVQQHIDDRAADEQHAAEKLRQENLAKAYDAIVAIVGAVQDDMYDRFGIPMELYGLRLSDVCGSESDWSGPGKWVIEDCSAGLYPVALDISCDVGASGEINYIIGGLASGSLKTQDPITNSWQIEDVTFDDRLLTDDKTLLELLREEQ